LDELRINHNYAKYQKHITESKKLIPIVVSEVNERLYSRRDKVAKAAEKRRRQGKGDEDKTELEIEAEVFADQYGKKVDDLTTKAEKAMRDLIDYSDELAMQETLMKDVSESIAAAPLAPAPRSPSVRRPRGRRHRAVDSDDDGEEEEEVEDGSPALEVEVLSAAELLKKAKEDYVATYTSKTMLER
jgi:hypothetical protein